MAQTTLINDIYGVVGSQGEITDLNIDGKNMGLVRATTSPGGGVALSANSHGASPDATWEENQAAFNAAFRAAETAGGGRVIASPGTYSVKGLEVGSHTIVDMPGVTLISPDSLTDNVVDTRVTTTTGSASGATLTVASADRVEVGSLIAVHEAGILHNTQFTVFTAAIDATQTTGLVLTTTTGFPTAGVLRIGTELIAYTGRSGGTLTGVTRGHLGTVAASHLATDTVHLARHHYAVVKAISGLSLTLDVAVSLGVTGATVSVGSVGIQCTAGLTVDCGASDGFASSIYGVSVKLCRNSVFDGLTVRRGGQGGVMLSRGTRNCIVTNLALHDCGEPAYSKGASLWLYQGATRNTVSSVTITGDAWVGIYLDDRTTTADGWDHPNNENVITGILIDVNEVTAGFPAGINIVGSNRNFVGIGTVRGGIVGISISQGSQGTTSDGSKAPCVENEICSLSIYAGQPWIAEAPGNWLHDLVFDDARATSAPSNPGLNYTANCKTQLGGLITLGARFANGNASAPSIGFASDPDSGFFLYADNAIGVALGGTQLVTMYSNELRLAEGVRIATGSTTGSRIGLTASQKLGFWGATAVVQPAGVDNATDSTDAVAKLNALLAKLRTIGLIAT